MALGNDPNTGSAYVDMVIPNHSSGARAEFTARLTRNIDNTGDSYNSKAIRNYEAVQNNKDTLPKSREFDNTPERQRARTLRMLRQQILTGKSGNKYTALNAEQKQQIAELFLETERERFGNMKDTKGNWLSFDEMRAIELTALGEQDTAVVKGQTINQEEAQRIYNAWSGQVWKSIFDDFDSGEYQGVHLTKTQTNHVATNEFWNKEADREHAYVNGFIFRSYVRRMGYQPMFAYTTTYTEVDADGNEIKGPDGKAVKVTYGDFSKSDGYYKLLIDRRMYDLDGNYREQNVINLSGYENNTNDPTKVGITQDTIENEGILTNEYGDTNFGKAAQKMPNVGRARNIGKNGNKYSTGSSLDSIINNARKNRTTILEETQNAARDPSANNTSEERSKFATNTIAHHRTLDNVAKRIAELSMEDGAYNRSNNLKSVYQAADNITKDKQGTINKILKGRASYSDIECDEAMLLIEDALHSGDYETAQELIRTTRERATSAGQFIQAFAKYSNTAASQLTYFDKYLATLTQAWEKRNPKRVHAVDSKLDNILASDVDDVGILTDMLMNEMSEWKLDREMAEQIAWKISRGSSIGEIRRATHSALANGFIELSNSELQEIVRLLDDSVKYGEYTKERIKAVNQACKIFTDHLTRLSLGQMFNAWRYDAMLGNFRTLGRNMIGNALFGQVVKVRNIVATAIEAGTDKIHFAKTGEHIDRTHSIGYGKALRTACLEDADNVAYKLSSNGDKYGVRQGVEATRKAYTEKTALGRGLNKFHDMIGNELEREDFVALSRAYAHALASYLHANGLTESIFNDESQIDTLNKARAYAIAQAQQATFRNCNGFAVLLNNLKRKASESESAGVRAAGLLLEGVMPFTNTPMNILARGLEYSPLGVFTGIVQAVQAVRTGKYTATQAIDRIAAGLVGTAVLGLGVLLSSMGLITGGEPDDDKERAEAEAEGWQAYSLHIGNTYYSLDWAAPTALPLFVGVELFNSVKNADDENGYIDNLFDALQNIAEPITEMSMLQSVNDLLNSISYSDNKIAGIVSSAATSYATQGITPTIVGQLSRTIDKTRRTTTSAKHGVSKSVDYALRKAANKTPFSFMLEPYVDVWGDTEPNSSDNLLVRALANFFSPGYLSRDNGNKVTDLVDELYNEAGDRSVLPSSYKPTNATKFDGVQRTLTEKERTTYNTTKGHVTRDTISTLMGSSWFNGLDHDAQIGVIADVYTYAAQMANQAVGADVTEKWVQEAIDAKAKGISETDYLIAMNAVSGIKGDKDKDGKTIQLTASKNKKAALDKALPYLSRTEKEYLYGCFEISQKVW